MFVADPALMLLLILLIGIAVGLLMYRYAGSRWLTQFTSTRRGYLTSALVGVAGSFTGYHLATIAAAGGIGIALIAAAMGAALLVWAWRTIKF
jgi:uncharacterized membrane protein YeaQ/YmgE (transglycosylase-associated protein family)